MIYIALCSVINAKKEYEKRADLISCFGDEVSLKLKKTSNSHSVYLSFGGLLALKSLSDRLISPHADLSIAYDESGKPSFKELNLPFNISHSASLSAAAIGELDEAPIGIDIELIDKRRNLKQIADRFFLEHELKSFKEHGYSADEFYRIWTAKEAYVKLCGASLSSMLSESDTVKLCSDKTIFLTHFKLNYEGDEYMLTIASKKETRSELFDISEIIRSNVV